MNEATAVLVDGEYEGLTKQLVADIARLNPVHAPTKEELEARNALIANCIKVNPFTKANFNLTRQIQLQNCGSPEMARVIAELARMENAPEAFNRATRELSLAWAEAVENAESNNKKG